MLFPKVVQPCFDYEGAPPSTHLRPADMFNVVVHMPKVYKNPKKDIVNKTKYQAFLMRTDPGERVALMEAPDLDTPEETLFELLAAMEKMMEAHPNMLLSPLENRLGHVDNGTLRELEKQHGVYMLASLFTKGVDEVDTNKRDLQPFRFD